MLVLGFGVKMDIKNMEYKAQDDQEIKAEKESIAAQDGAPFAVVGAPRPSFLATVMMGTQQACAGRIRRISFVSLRSQQQFVKGCASR